MSVHVKIQFLGKIPKKMKNSQIKIAGAHVNVTRINPAKFQKNPMNSLGGVVDNRFSDVRTDGPTYGRDGRTRVT